MEGEGEDEEAIDHGGQQLLCLFQHCIIQLCGGGRGGRRREKEEEEGEGGGRGGRRRREEGKEEKGRRMSGETDEKCSQIPDERIKMQTAGRREGRTFAGVDGGVDILGGFHKLPECTTIFRCYKLTAKINLIYSRKY